MAIDEQYSRDRRSSTEYVIDVVAAQTGTDPVRLPPLYDAIDPDALGAVIDTVERGAVSFEYAGQHVTVRIDGDVDVSVNPAEGSDGEEAATDD